MVAFAKSEIHCWPLNYSHAFGCVLNRVTMANWEAIVKWSLKHQDGTAREPQIDEEVQARYSSPFSFHPLSINLASPMARRSSGGCGLGSLRDSAASSRHYSTKSTFISPYPTRGTSRGQTAVSPTPVTQCMEIDVSACACGTRLRLFVRRGGAFSPRSKSVCRRLINWGVLIKK